MHAFVVCALYKFVRVDDHARLQKPLLELMARSHVRGTLLLASEGINGTIAGARTSVDSVLEWLLSQPEFVGLECKESTTSVCPFKRSRVKLKNEIVTMGVEGIDPAKSAGTYVEPGEWNALISDPDVLLIDTRNDYECEVGSFAGAVNPKTTNFREFPQFVESALEPGVSKQKKIAMFCTGGIRCEKSTAYLREKGFEHVYHLKGGVLGYLEHVPQKDSLWKGECFVFDERVTVDHQLEKGSYDQCHACRRPIAEEDRKSSKYVAGASCPRCYGKVSEDQKSRFLEREKQMRLSRARGEPHMGDEARERLLESRREKNHRKGDDESTRDI